MAQLIKVVVNDYKKACFANIKKASVKMKMNSTFKEVKS